MSIEAAALEDSLGRLGTMAEAPPGPDELIHEVVRATAALFDVSGVGLMLVDPTESLRYVAATGPEARLLEASQEETGEGPCVQAFVLGETVQTEDVQSDRRWPTVATALRGSSVHAVLGTPVVMGAAPVGSLDAYVERQRRFDPSEAEAIGAYASLVGRLLSLSIRAHRSDRLAEQLQYALDHRVAIERAIGFIMARDRASALQAFDALRRQARSSRRKVADVAAELLAGG